MQRLAALDPCPRRPALGCLSDVQRERLLRGDLFRAVNVADGSRAADRLRAVGDWCQPGCRHSHPATRRFLCGRQRSLPQTSARRVGRAGGSLRGTSAARLGRRACPGDDRAGAGNRRAAQSAQRRSAGQLVKRLLSRTVNETKPRTPTHGKRAAARDGRLQRRPDRVAGPDLRPGCSGLLSLAAVDLSAFRSLVRSTPCSRGMLPNRSSARPVSRKGHRADRPPRPCRPPRARGPSRRPRWSGW